MSGAVFDMATAMAALKIKRGRFKGHPDGTLIEQPGKPDLLLTWEAARQFNNDIREAESNV